MTTNKLSGSKLSVNRQATPATYTLHNDKRGSFYRHPHAGRVKLIALFCDCGRSIMVEPSEAKEASILCGLCNTPFNWQQLTFGAD